MRILVCGGRNFSDLSTPEKKRDEKAVSQYKFVMEVLHKITEEFSKHVDFYDNWLPSDITIISGGAKGVDSTAIDFAAVNWCPFVEFKANWKKYGKRAGPIRNQAMIDQGKPDLVVAFPGGTGTADMVSRAIKANIPVRIINE